MVTPNNPFIKFCIDNLPNYVNSYYYFGKHFHIMNSTGPEFLTNMIKKYNKEYYDKVENDNRPPGPWGKIGTGKPWYDYPYILHNIEYY